LEVSSAILVGPLPAVDTPADVAEPPLPPAMVIPPEVAEVKVTLVAVAIRPDVAEPVGESSDSEASLVAMSISLDTVGTAGRHVGASRDREEIRGYEWCKDLEIGSHRLTKTGSREKSRRQSHPLQDKLVGEKRSPCSDHRNRSIRLQGY